MITILLEKIKALLTELKTNIENLPTGEKENYSYVEQKIGKWVDGKVLYFKTYHPIGTFSLANNNWTDLIDVSELNIDYILECKLSFIGTNEITFSDGRLRYSYSTTTKMIRGASTGGTNVIDPFITIYYTKLESEED